ncbi:hypothetical protein KZ829_21525 [Actinoplanes hulinensis]|uniref:4Fe-4S Wbl-type domain-containing protein n=1 Tax=Actinoplanes hulinensis TaxID=1144547 RepID=A0ABS7B5W9_9ACTN|nr:hypothetical protein [Actinoplanes hulinensis]MBW6436323.1 hypothetical protein [Actinoplanes hulinensis]
MTASPRAPTPDQTSPTSQVLSACCKRYCPAVRMCLSVSSLASPRPDTVTWRLGAIKECNGYRPARLDEALLLAAVGAVHTERAG